ncbi:MAG: ABC-2 family transporter protein [Candidatus Nanohaloarchaeota archaeon QJJ-9]|nr:ABC-2 family transporter protein [Candidatus Nanohaloarchaeota archaeon QJJ-9]
MYLKKYYQLMHKGFSKYSQYRFNALARFLSAFIFLAVLYYLWKAIAASGSLERSFMEIFTYLVMARIVASTVSISVENRIGTLVRRGNVVNELKRPVSLRTQMFFGELGVSVFKTLTRSIPVFLVMLFFIEIPLPGSLRFLGFLFSLGLAYCLVFLFSYSMAMFVFWTKVGWSLAFIRDFLTRFFGGGLFPLYILPPFLQNAFSFLPFKSMIYTPASIFVGEVALSNIPNILFKQLVWLGILFLASSLIWRRAKEKLTVQGG